MATPRKTDLAALLERDDVDVDVQVRPKEPPADRKARHESESRAAAHRRRLDWAILSLLAVVALACLGITFAFGPSDDRFRWATATLTSIVTAGLGFLAGKATR